jgi:hypothetical protein
MPRRFRRYARSARTVKPVRYSNETISGQDLATLDKTSYVASVIVAATDAQGVRKVKNPTLRLVSSPSNPLSPVLWVLAYVPQGFENFQITMGNLGGAPVSVYEPNQNVIMSGILNPAGTQDPVTYRSRLARNLESGDRIVLFFYNPAAEPIQVLISFTFNYAICYG